MNLILVLAALIANSYAVTRLQFNCSSDYKSSRNEMEGGRGANADLYKWDKVVSYFFAAGVTVKDKAFIEKQMRLVEEKTCVTFTKVSENSAPDHHLEIKVGQGSCSPNPGFVSFGGGVGHCSAFQGGCVNSFGKKMIFNSQAQLADNPLCEGSTALSGGVLHELMHVLGAMHTHKRMDRDKYIDYRKECLMDPYYEAQFNKEEQTLPSDGLNYEYGSIMHYGCGTWARSTDCPTIKPKSGDCSLIGKSQATQQDWKMIRQYQCDGDTGTATTDTNQVTTDSNQVTTDSNQVTTDSNQVTTDAGSCQYQNYYGDEWCNSSLDYDYYGQLCSWASYYCQKACFC